MEHLQREIERMLATLPDAARVRERLKSLVSIYPFNEWEFILSHLLAKGALTLDEYVDLREAYNNRNQNRRLFSYGPTAFGTTWAHEYLQGLAPELTAAPGSEYDLQLDGKIRIEVKASRAVDRNSKRSLVEKALTTDSSKSFLMNFQQTKPKHFDVIVWIGVWLDKIRLWVLSADEVAAHKRFSGKQHRGNKGEGQLHVTDRNVLDFDAFEAQLDNLADAIRETYRRQVQVKESRPAI